MFFALLPVNTRLLISPTRCLQALRSNKRWSRSGLRKAWKFPVADISRLMNIRFSEYFWVSVPTPILGKDFHMAIQDARLGYAEQDQSQ